VNAWQQQQQAEHRQPLQVVNTDRERRGLRGDRKKSESFGGGVVVLAQCLHVYEAKQFNFARCLYGNEWYGKIYRFVACDLWKKQKCAGWRWWWWRVVVVG
jgi:hypothetical protein